MLVKGATGGRWGQQGYPIEAVTSQDHRQIGEDNPANLDEQLQPETTIHLTLLASEVGVNSPALKLWYIAMKNSDIKHPPFIIITNILYLPLTNSIRSAFCIKKHMNLMTISNVGVFPLVTVLPISIQIYYF